MNNSVAGKNVVIPILNRASYSRIKSLISKLEEMPEFSVTLFLGSSLVIPSFGNGAAYIEKNHEKVKIFKADTLTIVANPFSYYGICVHSAHIILQFSKFLEENSFHFGIVLADRYETLPIAMVLSYFGIPIVHMQGGEVTENIDDRIRHAVTKLSDYHFTSTKLSKLYLEEMGEHPNKVFNFGCPSLDVIHEANIKRSKIFSKDYICIFHPLTSRLESLYEQTSIVLDSCIKFYSEKKYRCYWYYPNPDPGRSKITDLIDEYITRHPYVFTKAVNEEPEEFLLTLSKARFIIGNSSSLMREAGFLGVPAINLGDRQGLRERGLNVFDCKIEKSEIVLAMKYQSSFFHYQKSKTYGDGRSSLKIAKQLAKIDFVKKGTLTYPYWEKYRHEHFGERRFRNNVGNK